MRSASGLGMVLAISAMAVLISAPATVLEHLDYQQNTIRAAGCFGRLWAAGSCRVFLKAQEGWSSLGMLSFFWRLEDWAGWHLVIGHDGRTVAYVRPSVTGWSARNVEIQTPLLPIDWLPKHLYNVLQPVARVVITAPSITCDWQANDCTGKMQVRIDDLSLGKTNNLLGNYLIDVELRSGGYVEGKLSTSTGALTLQGRFEVSRGKQLQYAGSATLGNGVAEDVRRLLESVGQPAGANNLTFPRAS